jgi:hypothetical protein
MGKDVGKEQTTIDDAIEQAMILRCMTNSQEPAPYRKNAGEWKTFDDAMKRCNCATQR